MKDGHRAAGLRAHAGGIFFSVVLFPALALLVTYVLLPMLPVSLDQMERSSPLLGPILRGVVRSMSLTGLSFVLSPFALIIAIPVFLRTLRNGVAGWFVAVLIGSYSALFVALVLGIVANPDTLASLALAGGTVGLAYWLGVRLAAPAAVAPRPTA